MALVLTNGKISVGAYRISNRKHIALCVEQRGALNICGYFTSKEQAEFCMHKIAEILRMEVENPSDYKEESDED